MIKECLSLDLANERKNMMKILMAGVLFSLLLCVVRIQITGKPTYIFLNWNLFLAAVPYCISTLLIISDRLRDTKWLSIPLLSSWLLFFPNAPYILTDLFHLRYTTGAPHWFDLILILSYAWTGLLLGLLSLLDIEQLISNHLKPLITSILTSGLLYLCAFGIYLGRYLRFNSWEIISDPLELIWTCLTTLFSPDLTAIGVTFGLGTFLLLGYKSIKMLRIGNGLTASL